MTDRPTVPRLDVLIDRACRHLTEAERAALRRDLDNLRDRAERAEGEHGELRRLRDQWEWRAEDAQRTTRLQRERAERAEQQAAAVCATLADRIVRAYPDDYAAAVIADHVRGTVAWPDDEAQQPREDGQEGASGATEAPRGPEPADDANGPHAPAQDREGACCVCGGGPVVYRNYREQPFCEHCAGCQCTQNPCVRTGANDPAVSEEAAGRSYREYRDRFEAQMVAAGELIDERNRLEHELVQARGAVDRVTALVDRWTDDRLLPVGEIRSALNQQPTSQRFELPTVIHRTPEQLRQQRAQLIASTGLDEQTLRQRAADYQLPVEHQLIWNTVEGIDYLLDQPDTEPADRP